MASYATACGWVHGHNKLADSMTKARPSSALKALIDSNFVDLTATEWVDRKGV